MELFQLRYFLKVVELGNFTRAAEASSVSQPALSQAIQKLEDELGQPVFERLGRHVELTDAGQMLLPRATQAVQLVDEARASITDDGESGLIRVSAIPTIAPYLLPSVLGEFASQLPQVHFEVQEEVTDQVVKRLRHGETDAALLALPFDATHLEVMPRLKRSCNWCSQPGTNWPTGNESRCRRCATIRSFCSTKPIAWLTT